MSGNLSRYGLQSGERVDEDEGGVSIASFYWSVAVAAPRAEHTQAHTQNAHWLPHGRLPAPHHDDARALRHGRLREQKLGARHGGDQARLGLRDARCDASAAPQRQSDPPSVRYDDHRHPREDALPATAPGLHAKFADALLSRVHIFTDLPHIRALVEQKTLCTSPVCVCVCVFRF